MKIILANLGNRNISFKGRTFSDLQPNDKLGCTNFRGFTEKLLQNYESLKEYISINILTDLIDNMPENPEKLFIFFTDAPQGERNDQDTIFEAQIITKKFIELYPSVEVISYALKCRVTDADEMMKRYRMYLTRIIKNHSLEEVIVCESGGAPQQKFALKIISEFLFDTAILKSYSVEVGLGNIVIRQQPAIEYKNVIVEEQSSALISIGDFSGALTLLKYKNNSNPNRKLIALLEVSNYLMRNDLNRALKALNTIPIQSLQISQTYKSDLSELSLFNESYEFISDLMKKKDHQTCCILLSIANWKLTQKSYGEAALYFSIFIENYLTAVINFEASEFEVDGYGDKFERFLSGLNEGLIFPGLELPNYIDIQKGASVPFKIAVADHINHTRNKNIVGEIKKANSHFKRINGERNPIGLDSLRNKFAHEGKHITVADYQPFQYFGSQMSSLFSMPSNSIFDILINSCFELMV